MSHWDDYKREERQRLAPGDHRVEIVDVEETTSRAGNPMLVVSIRPNQSKITIRHCIVKNDYFNRNMTEFFDSFNVEEGDFAFPTWVGAVGAARLKEDENGYLKVGWFLSQEKADDLPPWVGALPERQEITSIGTFAPLDDDDDLPFV